jgi:hypothetical protein
MQLPLWTRPEGGSGPSCRPGDSFPGGPRVAGGQRTPASPRHLEETVATPRRPGPRRAGAPQKHPGEGADVVARRVASRLPNLKRGEPHGRLQGATDLQGTARRKPSKLGGTARTERTRELAAPGRRQRHPLAGERGREWTRAADVDGGVIFGQPQERSPHGHDAGVWPTARWCRAGRSRSYGRLGLVVSEGEDKARGSCQGT